jgi:uncharacterized membrane protein
VKSDRARLSTLDVLTFLVLAASLALTASVFDRLPDPMPTHFDLRGRPDGWMPRSVGAWLVPAIAAGVVALLRVITLVMPSGWRERLMGSPVRFILFAVSLFAAGVQVLVIRAALDRDPHLGTSIFVLLGALFFAMGIVLPRTRRNPFFGVRTPFALTSDENWARTQRVGSYAWTTGGVVVFAAGMVGSPSVAVAAIAVTVLAPVVWSWLVARGGPGDIPPMSTSR